MMSHTGSSTENIPNDDQIDNNTDFGKRLAEARKAKNYTVDEVSRHLKIPARTIIALETSDKEELPVSTFTQGYIRAYARFLEISAQDVLAVYNRAVPHDDVSDLKPRSKLPDEASSQSPLIKAITTVLVLVVIVIIVFGGVRYYQKKADALEDEFDAEQKSFTGNSLNSPGSLPIAIEQNARLHDGELVVGKVDAYVPAAEEAETDETVAGKAGDAIAQPAATTEKTTVVMQAEAKQIENSPTDTDNNSDSIEIIAKNGSWVEVRDANKSRLFYNMLPVGGDRELVGRAPFSVTMGNAKTTRVVVNGINVDVSDYIRSNNTASFKVSTQGQDVIFH